MSWVVEHKTTSLDIAPGSRYWRRLAIDAQVSNYLAAVRAMGHEATGMLYDVVRKPTLAPAKATPVEAREYTKPKDKACPGCKSKSGAASAPHAFIDGVLQESCDDGSSAPVTWCTDGRIVTDPGGKLYANMRENDEEPEEYRQRLRQSIGEEPDRYYQRAPVGRTEEQEHDGLADVWATARNLRDAEIARRYPRNADACDSFGSLCPYFDVCAGSASLEDPALFRDSGEHEELGGAAVEASRRLPVVTTSSLKTFRSCPKKYFYAYVRRRRPVESSAPLRFGTLFHVGLEAWWLSGGNLEAAIAALRAHGEPDAFESVKAEELLLGYHVRWSGEEAVQPVAVEHEFVVPIINPATGRASVTYQLGGKLDALVERICA